MVTGGTTIDVHDYLFGNGQQLSDYFIEQALGFELLCYRDAQGREFDLLIDNDDLVLAAIARLKELGVQIVRLG